MVRAIKRAQALGFGNSFSAYIAKLIRDDVAERGALSETPEPAHAKPGPPNLRPYKLSRKRKAKVA